jgi:recombinational DNA repair ATPase RecF
MKLINFRVTNFRSVEDSGLISASNVTALIGVNESGKTNLLIPLWKLKPVKGGQIDPIADYPRKHYNEIRGMENKPFFIEANFELTSELAQKVADLSGTKTEDVQTVCIKRDLGGRYANDTPRSKQRGIKRI